MACPAILTGDAFLTRIIGNIDCQSQLVGSLGWQALGQPGSIAASMMAGLLTLFVALFAIRLLFGSTPGARDIVLEVLKVGIVLTLAFSWPAFRTLIYDVVNEGPAEIATTITAPVRAGDETPFLARLQTVDNAMVRLTELGTGRQTGAFIDSKEPGGTFRGTALQDESALGNARLIWLAGVIGAFALLRLAGGLLLALGPLAAGMLLFEATRGLFTGWLRGLVLALLGTIAETLVLAVEVEVLAPWLTDALHVRTLGYATPSAPTELFAMTLAFTLVQFAMIWLVAKVAFARGWISLPSFENVRSESAASAMAQRSEPRLAVVEGRAQRIADGLEIQLRREESARSERTQIRTLLANGSESSGNASGGGSRIGSADRLGSSWRRTHNRGSMAARRRDGGT